MLIMVYAERSLALGKSVYLRTIDTDAILQSSMFTSGEVPGGTLDLHVANVYQTADGSQVFSTVAKAGSKAVRCREIVDVCMLKARLSVESRMLILLYGCDYIKGMCIRGLGLPKKQLHSLIVRGPPKQFVMISRDKVVIDWSAFFAVVGTACKPPKPTASVNTDELNTEMQRLAYCMAYFAGVALEAGGPAVDTREVVQSRSLPTLLRGTGCAGTIVYED